MLVSLFLGRVPLAASLGLALWSAGVSGATSEQQTTTALSSFLPSQPGTLWVYVGVDGLKRIESLRSLDAEGKLLVDVEELRGTECLRRFSYESALEGNRWVRRGPDGDEVILSPPLQPGTRWQQLEQVELEVLSSSERVQVRAGTFSSCLKLRKRAGERDTYLYLAPGVGVVRETTVANGVESTVVELTEHHLPRIAPTTEANTADDTEAIRAELEKIVARSQETPVRTGGAIRAPKRIGGVDPETPPLAARAHLKATVVVQIVIERDGRVSEVTFLRPAPQFEQEVRRALSTWKYEPVLLDGKPVRATLTLTIRFQ